MFCSNCAAPLDALPPTTCVACGVSHWANPKPGAAALVLEQGRLLLLRRANEPWRGHWDLPGGFCEPFEHPAATAVRETLEEVGLAVRVTGLLGMWMDHYPTEHPGPPAEVILSLYFHAVALPGSRVRLDPAEALEFGWFEPAGLPQPIGFPDHLPAVLASWRRAIEGGRSLTEALEGAPPP